MVGLDPSESCSPVLNGSVANTACSSIHCTYNVLGHIIVFSYSVLGHANIHSRIHSTICHVLGHIVLFCARTC